MSNRPSHTAAEARFRDLLRQSDLPEPDEVARLRDCLVFCWHDRRAVVVIDLDDPLDTLPGEAAGEACDGPGDGRFLSTA